MRHRPRVPAHDAGATRHDSPERRALRFAHQDAGAPLAPDTRARMEARFAHDFADVRVHDGPAASAAAQDVSARAFTVGRDIVFDAGEHAPWTAHGERLLAHELAHAVQNARGAPGDDLPLVSAGHERGEAEARAVAPTVASGGAAAVEAAPAAVIARSPQGQKDEPGFFENMSSYFGLAESLATGKSFFDLPMSVAEMNKFQKGAGGAAGMFGQYSDVFGVYGGLSGMFGGISSLANGGGAGGALDTGKGLLDTVSGFGGLAGSGPVEGIAGMGSAAIDVGRGLYTAIDSDDVKEATGGAYQVAGGIASGITSAGDSTGNPFLMGGGRALGAGLKAGEKLVNWTDAGAKERGDWGKNEYGENRTGSEEAADTGRWVEDKLDDHIPDWAAGILGGGAAIGKSWWNAGKGAVNNIADRVTLDPDEIDWGKTIRPWNWFD